MADTIKLPGIGPVKKMYVYVGGALIIGVVGYAYVKQSQAATEEAVEETPLDSDYTTDEFGYGPAYATDYAYDGGYAPGVYIPSPPVASDPLAERDPVNDMEWVARVIEFLEQVGVDNNAASLAVSKYRLKECMSATEADIVRRAVGRWSTPPQTPNLTIMTCPGPPPTTTPPPTTPPTTTPKPLGSVTGIKAKWFRNHVGLNWNPVSGASGYTIYVNGQRKTTVTYSQYNLWGLSRKKTYTIGIRALKVDPTGPGSADIQGPMASVKGKTV